MKGKGAKTVSIKTNSGASYSRLKTVYILMEVRRIIINKQIYKKYLLSMGN